MVLPGSVAVFEELRLASAADTFRLEVTLHAAAVNCCAFASSGCYVDQQCHLAISLAAGVLMGLHYQVFKCWGAPL